jgi:hypothetical protein
MASREQQSEIRRGYEMAAYADERGAKHAAWLAELDADKIRWNDSNEENCDEQG